METQRILIVDDEEKMRKLLSDFLKRAGFDTVEASDGEQALEIYTKDRDIALIILDVMMPKMDGWQVCRAIREFSQVPIIMLTARDAEQDELMGFQLGVDEYITKPFRAKILVARVEAILRRSAKPVEEGRMVCGLIEMDKGAHQVYVQGNAVDLSFKEFALLEFLMENQGIALSREKILDYVWNFDYYGDARTVDTHVKKLRSKLGKPAGDQIITIRCMGYKLEQQVPQ